MSTTTIIFLHQRTHHNRQPHANAPVRTRAQPSCCIRSTSRWWIRTRRRARHRAVRCGRATHIRDATAILLGNDVDLASGVGTHVQPALGIPGEANWAEAGARAGGEVSVGDDVYSGGVAVCEGCGGARAIELHEAEFVADGGLAVPRRYG